MAAAGGLTPGLQAVLDAAAFAGTPVLVALGGGADSAVLAWAVRDMGCPVRGATVDHGLPASSSLIAAARALAANLGIGYCVVPAPAAGGSEAALRAARYRALEIEARPDEIIATGHTADDQAETVLGNLLRGAGAGGLSGIPERRGRWARPLLGVTREEVRAAADQLGLPYVDDPGNTDLTRRRNVLRHEVLPLLAARIGPGARAAINRAAALVAADDAALEARAAAVPLRRAGGVILLPAAALATLPPPIAARAARRALRLLLDPYPGHGQDVEAILLTASAAGSAARPLQGGHLAVREGPWVVLCPAARRPVPEPVPLLVPGQVRFGEWVVRAEGPLPAPALLPVGRREALVVPSVAAASLVVRGALPGDRVDAGRGHKAVAEALREAGIPASRRPGWPVVVAGGTIAWVPGARLAAWAADRGASVVRLRLEEAL